MPVMEKLLTVEEVALGLQVSKDTLWRLLKQKKLVGYRVAGAWRVHPDDIKRYLETQKNTNQTE